MAFLLWDARAALVDMFETAVAALTGVTVADGPRSRGATPKRYVLVGAAVTSPASEVSADGGTATHEWSVMGPGERQESGAIPCTAVAWHGKTTFAELRDDVADIVAACEAAVIADPTLGGVLDHVHAADVSGLSIIETQTANGAAVHAVFTVTYGATT